MFVFLVSPVVDNERKWKCSAGSLAEVHEKEGLEMGFFLRGIAIFFLTSTSAWYSARKLRMFRNQRRGTALCSSEPDPDGLWDTMQKSLGEKNDVSELAEAQSREVMRGLKELDRDPNIIVNNKFLEWLDANGVWVKSQSTWGRAQHPLVSRQSKVLYISSNKIRFFPQIFYWIKVISSNTEDDGESCGRGILSKEPIGEGELLLTVPLDLCLTRLVAQVIYIFIDIKKSLVLKMRNLIFNPFFTFPFPGNTWKSDYTRLYG